MIEKYDLTKDTLPIIPTPHDCVIKEIEYTKEYLIFKFDKDIANYDSIKYLKPNATSLTMRIHFIDEDFNIYKYRKMLFKEGYILLPSKKFCISQKHTLEYLYHTIGYSSIHIELFQDTWLLLEISADYVELEWTEK